MLRLILVEFIFFILRSQKNCLSAIRMCATTSNNVASRLSNLLAESTFIGAEAGKSYVERLSKDITRSCVEV